MTQLKLIFLDLNGTVVDDWDCSYAAVRAIFTHYGKTCPPFPEYIMAVSENGDYHNFYLRNGIHATRSELHDIFIPAYLAHREEMVVTPGAQQFVGDMVRMGVEVHLLTAARRDFAEPLVEASGIGEHCAAFHYHVHDKAAQVQAVLHGSVVQPQESLMVGDLPSDIRAAHESGAHGALIINACMPQDIVAMARTFGCIAVGEDFHALSRELRNTFRNLAI